MISPTLQTKNYTIRPLNANDISLWQLWDTDPKIQAYMPEPVNTAQTHQEHLEYLSECEKDVNGYYWSIETQDGITIGTVSLTEINFHHKTAEIGIVIGNQDYWGKGVATEIISELIAYSFKNLDIAYIQAEVEAENIPMQKVLEKVGFKKDGIFEKARIKNGHRINVVHLSIAV